MTSWAAPMAWAQNEIARVPTAHANVHKGPSTNDEVLVLAPQGSEMLVVGRRGEWVQVRLSPELRARGMVMRWYEDETDGWMHDSTVEIGPVAAP